MKSLSDFQNMAYLGSLYIGSDSNVVDVTFDTGSAYLAVCLSNLTSCPGPTYNPEESSTGVVFNDEENTLYYGGMTLETYFSVDNVCLDIDGNNCVSDFNFYSIYKETGLNDGESGVLGLSPNNTYAFLPGNDMQYEDSFVV